jgi:hypothetical protein
MNILHSALQEKLSDEQTFMQFLHKGQAKIR